MENRRFIKLFLLSIFLLGIIFIAIMKGPVNIPFSRILCQENRQIIHLRMLRVLLAIIVGGGLAVSGAALQAILRNPLAEPYLLGTSSGAGLGATAAIILGLSGILLPGAAFLGAVISVILVYNLARRGNKVPADALILSGVIVSIALSAIIVFLVSISSNESLHGVLWWLWGSLQVYDSGFLFVITAIVCLGTAIIFLLSQDLNAIMLGEENAVHLGIDIEVVKKILFFVTALITASLVCVCGIIGFVGLIIPHMMRLIVGPNHKVLIPAVFLGGAGFMVVCDLVSRTIYPPLEIPIGVVTALIGAPVFVVLLKRGRRI